MYATARWANTHHEETAGLLAGYAKMDVATVLAMSRCPYGDALGPHDVQNVYNVAYKYKVFDRPVDAAAVIARI